MSLNAETENRKMENLLKIFFQNRFVSHENIYLISLFYSKLFRKFISEDHLQLSVIEKNKKGKVGIFILNPYILDNFTYNIEQILDSDKGHSKYI